MGCVLGTRAAGQSRRNHKERPTSDSARVRNHVAKAATRISEPPAQAAADNRRHPRRHHHHPPPQQLCNLSNFSANSATNQQGWPLWLVDVAGDAIKDWTPRRANTFEKLDKVIIHLRHHLSNSTLSVYIQNYRGGTTSMALGTIASCIAFLCQNTEYWPSILCLNHMAVIG